MLVGRKADADIILSSPMSHGITPSSSKARKAIPLSIYQTLTAPMSMDEESNNRNSLMETEYAWARSSRALLSHSS